MVIRSLVEKTVIRNIKKMKKKFGEYKQLFSCCTILYVSEIYEYMYPILGNMDIKLKGVNHNEIRLMVFDEKDKLKYALLVEESEAKRYAVCDDELNVMGKLEVFESADRVLIEMSIGNETFGTINNRLSSTIPDLNIERKVSKADYKVFRDDKIVVHSDYFAEFNSIVIPEYADKTECIFIALAMQLINTPKFLDI
ncbi:MAG: hypothetical protein ACOX4R_06350 [Lentihominibacter sp.]